MLLILYLKSISMNTLFFQRNIVTASCPLVPLQVPSRLETHLWYVVPDEVKSTALLSQYSDILSPCEKENVYCMRGDQLKKRALLARVLVRTTIARYQIGGQTDPKSLKFRKNIHGKPELEFEDGHLQSPLQFNISHTSSLIACGVTRDSPIGIDVEEKQRKMKSNILAFARRYFSPDEVELLSSISDPESQRQQFIKLWTLKEAYVKALGKGFSAQPFKTFTIKLNTHDMGDICPSKNLNSQGEISVESADGHSNPKSNWRFMLLELAGSHYAAICVKRDQTGRGPIPLKLTVRKTIPYVGDKVCDANVISA